LQSSTGEAHILTSVAATMIGHGSEIGEQAALVPCDGDHRGGTLEAPEGGCGGRAFCFAAIAHGDNRVGIVLAARARIYAQGRSDGTSRFEAAGGREFTHGRLIQRPGIPPAKQLLRSRKLGRRPVARSSWSRLGQGREKTGPDFAGEGKSGAGSHRRALDRGSEYRFGGGRARTGYTIDPTAYGPKRKSSWDRGARHYAASGCFSPAIPRSRHQSLRLIFFFSVDLIGEGGGTWDR